MIRPKQRILLLVTCAAACAVYFLSTRGKEQANLIQNRELANRGLELQRQANLANSQASNLVEIHESSDKGIERTAKKNAEKVDQAAKQAVTPIAELRTKVLEQISTACKIYSELRNVDFQQPTLEYALCSKAKAYEKAADGYPMCKLKKPFDERILSIVRSGSATTDLLDMKNAKMQMFVYPEKDYISERIKAQHQWEPELVHTTLKLALKVPNATFLDAGCNIGVYSLLAARLGFPVVSLDANIRNLLRLRLSLDAATLDASLVWNFIGSGEQLSYLNFPADCNVGGATKFGRAVTDTIPVMPVRSERLCDLIGTKNVVIKLDIEGGEADFLRTSGRLFSQFKVAFVQMEFLGRHMVGNDRTTIIEFFSGKNYTAWRTPGLTALDAKAAATWPDGDILWVHEEFQQLI